MSTAFEPGFQEISRYDDGTMSGRTTCLSDGTVVRESFHPDGRRAFTVFDEPGHRRLDVYNYEVVGDLEFEEHIVDFGSGSSKRFTSCIKLAPVAHYVWENILWMRHDGRLLHNDINPFLLGCVTEE